MDKGRITGIGGIFFKCEDPQKVKDWYQQKLGMITDQYGALFEFRQANDPDLEGYTQWSPFKSDTDYFNPSNKAFMVNYRVDDMDALLVKLKAAGVEILGEVQEFDYGKFAHIIDPEGNKIELWEPVDQVFTKSHEGKTNK